MNLKWEASAPRLVSIQQATKYSSAGDEDAVDWSYPRRGVLLLLGLQKVHVIP